MNKHVMRTIMIVSILNSFFNIQGMKITFSGKTKKIFSKFKKNIILWKEKSQKVVFDFKDYPNPHGSGIPHNTYFNNLKKTYLESYDWLTKGNYTKRLEGINFLEKYGMSIYTESNDEQKTIIRDSIQSGAFIARERINDQKIKTKIGNAFSYTFLATGMGECVHACFGGSDAGVHFLLGISSLALAIGCSSSEKIRAFEAFINMEQKINAFDKSSHDQYSTAFVKREEDKNKNSRKL